MNTSTPRIFIAATEQNAGKTTIALGLYANLRDRMGRIGFIKPVGQRFTEVDGKRIDEDSVLIHNTFNTQIPIEDMSPIAVEADFTRRYINQANHEALARRSALVRNAFDTQIPIEDISPVAVEPDFTRRYINQANHEALVRRIQHSFDRACWEKDFAIIEGTGHAGVGSTFDLSNAAVARLLESKVVLVTPGGIGRPIDEAALNKALFDREGVEVIGVVMNKVLPEKLDYVSDFAGRGLERLGLELLGVIPMETMLAAPTLQQICSRIHGEFLCNQSLGGRRSARFLIGAVSSANLFAEISANTLLIVPGDREDVILAALSRSIDPDAKPLTGMILSDDLRPHGRLLEMLMHASLPIVFSEMDSYTITQHIHSMTVKTMPGDMQKIERIQNLISRHVSISRLLEKIGCPSNKV